MNSSPAAAKLLSIVMPVRDDGNSLQIVSKVINALLTVPHEIVVVHDTADDDAIEAVAALRRKFDNVFCVHNRRGRGVANAVISGVEAAHGDYVVTFAADDLGPVLALERMVRHMDAGCDFVSVTRYGFGGKCFGGTPVARLLSRWANRTFGWLSSSALTDCTMGFKMFRKDIFPQFQLNPKGAGWSFAFEMSIKAQLLGLTIGEVPIVSLNRLFDDEGTSSFSLWSWIKVYLRWYWYGARKLHLLRPRAPVMRLDKPNP
jgi:dolichol-phosphate mannosyltransferase